MPLVVEVADQMLNKINTFVASTNDDRLKFLPMLNTRCFDPYFTVPVNDISTEQCTLLCQKEEKCIAFTQYGPDEKRRVGCLLFDSIAKCDLKSEKWISGIRGMYLFLLSYSCS